MLVAGDTYCYHPTSGPDSDLKSGIVEAEWDALDPTNVNVDYKSTCKFTGSGETDVVWIEDNNLSALGTTECNALNLSGTCDQAYIKLDHGNIDGGTHDEAQESKTACHELGHSVGLTHHIVQNWDYQCMSGGQLVPGTSNLYQRYDVDHHIPDHINPNF